jgi:hypothetical protein
VERRPPRSLVVTLRAMSVPVYLPRVVVPDYSVATEAATSL